MTKKKFDANENREKIFCRDHYRCQRCGKMLVASQLQLAHRIMKGKSARKYIERYLYENKYIFCNSAIDMILHHDLNLVTSCVMCNDSFNIFNNCVSRDKLIDEIITNITETKHGIIRKKYYAGIN